MSPAKLVIWVDGEMVLTQSWWIWHGRDSVSVPKSPALAATPCPRQNGWTSCVQRCPLGAGQHPGVLRGFPGLGKGEVFAAPRAPAVCVF